MSLSGTGFAEGSVMADGFRIRYRAAGDGDPLVVLHGASGMRVSRSHELLAEQRRVILVEVPGFGQSPVNDRSKSMPELAMTVAAAIGEVGLERFDLMGNSFGGKLALWLALQRPESVKALVLVAPAAIRPDPPLSPPRTPEEAARRMHAHPERQPLAPSPEPAVVEKQDALVRRLIGPARDHELERLLPELNVPVLVLFGTRDGAIPPEMGRHYREKLPNCSLVLVYDAAHILDADRPEAFASVVSDFLQRHEGFLVRRDSALIHP